MPPRSRFIRVLPAAAATLLLASCSGAPAPVSSAPSGAAASRGGVSQVRIELASGSAGDECRLSARTAQAGPITFTVVNTSATGISELELLSGQRIVGEKENLVPGLDAVSFTATLSGGRYAVYCPGAAAESVPFTVTGTATGRTGTTAAALLTTGTRTYARYAAGTIADLVVAVRALQQAVDAGDLAGARTRYATARRFYEKVESDVGGFVKPGFGATDNRGNLDYLIDMRASNLDPAVGWHGFHGIERDLWQRNRITSGTRALAGGLTADVTALARLAKALDYRPEDLANGAAGLLEEIQSSKIKGTEEAYAHTDLADFAANIEGAEQAFANLQPGLAKIDPALTARVAERFAAVKAALEQYRDPRQPGGYRRYTAAVRAADAQRLSTLVLGLQEPLSRIAEKVATA